MAERRMFSKKIVESDAFQDMSISAQLLYYKLGMEADDDGFVKNPKSIAKSIECTADKLNELIGNGFVLTFPSGVICIKDWKVNNYIQTDRYHKTHYTEEKALLKIKDNGVYILDTEYMDTEDRLGKDRLGKDRIDFFIKKPDDITDFIPEAQSICDTKEMYMVFKPELVNDFFAYYEQKKWEGITDKESLAMAMYRWASHNDDLKLKT